MGGSTGPDDAAQAAWEDAYARFETPAEETAKFRKRLRALGADGWPRDLRILELCCGRGSGLAAWRGLGFRRVLGLDLSAPLLGRAADPTGLVAGDARRLPVRAGSVDVACVQGGLHHLDVTADLDDVLREVARVLAQDGRFVVVEPWDTLFLRAVHAASRLAPVRRLSAKVDAFARMVELERTTYEDWLARPDDVTDALARAFTAERRAVGWGKLAWVGRPRDR